MSRISIAELAKAISVKHNISQDAAEAFVAEFFNVIDNGLHDEKAVKVRGFGTFKVIDVRERESIDVNTGERVVIEGHGKVNFTPDPIMRDLVNKPFAKFDTVVLNDGVDVDELNKIGGEELNEDVDEEPETEEEEHTDTEKDVTSVEVVQQEEECEPEAVEPITCILNNAETAVTEPVTEIIGGQDMLSEEVEEPLAEKETPTITPEETIPDEVTEEEMEDEEPGFFRRNFVSVCVIGALLIAGIAFAGGYLLGQHLASQPVFKSVKVYTVKKEVPKTNAAVTVDTTKNAVTKPQEQPSVASKKEEKATEKASVIAEKPTAQPAKQVETHSATLDLAQRQVKTGAYTITGTAQTVTVRKGQTLKSISKSYLGDGMECYIQVHNGVSEVSEGMKLKIPQLKLKRR